MSKTWSLLAKYLKTRQAGLCLCLVLCSTVEAKGVRKPSSYLPDDDVIVAPVNNEMSFYQQYVLSDKTEEVALSRNQMKIWSDNQVFADQYGMDSSLTGAAFYVPTQQEKFEYFKSKYMRYLRSKGERPLKDMPKNWYNTYRASNEVDTIDELENRFRSTTKKSNSGSALPSALQEKEVSLWKNTKFIFQPRLDQGLVIIGFRTKFAYARAWVGINGKTEFNVQQTYDKIGLRMMFNYENDTGKYFTSLDKHLVGNYFFRTTVQRNPNNQQNEDIPVRDTSLMLLYARTF
jgi:hypothetical protein